MWVGDTAKLRREKNTFVDKEFHLYPLCVFNVVHNMSRLWEILEPQLPSVHPLVYHRQSPIEPQEFERTVYLS